MANTFFSTSFREGLLCYQCSACGNPVISRATVCLATRTVDGLLSDLPPEKAPPLMVKKFEEAVNNSYREQTHLGKYSVPSKALGAYMVLLKNCSSSEYFIEISRCSGGRYAFIDGLKAPCPICGNCEPWQEDAGDLSGLREENFPQLEWDLEWAVLRSCQRLQRKFDRLNTARSAPGKADAAKRELMQLGLRSAQFRAACEALGKRKAQWAALDDELRALAEKKASCKFFDIETKSEIGYQIDEKQKEADALQAELTRAEQQIKQEFGDYEIQTEELSYLAYGAADSLEAVLCETATAFRLKHLGP